MPDVLNHDVKKFSDAGLQLRLPVDSIPAGEYSRLSNIIPVIEGQLETRPGLTSLASISSSSVHTIFRLNQQTNAVSPERIVGSGQSLYSQQLSPTPQAFAALTGLTYDGTPLTIIPFRFDGDPSSWAIISNTQGMRKRRRPSLYQTLGQTPPTTAATASAGAAGNLNNGAGPGYDWVYTYVNSVTNTESNPSPANLPTLATQRPTAFVNPDAISQGNPCTNPANAYDGNTGTFAQFDGDSNAITGMSCRFQTWASIGTVTGLTLSIDTQVTTTGTTGSIVASLFYSIDNGMTWQTIYSTNVARGRLTDTINLPLGTDLTKLLVRASAVGGTTSTGGTGGGDTGGGGGGRQFNVA